jgi:hypothetical protein
LILSAKEAVFMATQWLVWALAALLLALVVACAAFVVAAARGAERRDLDLGGVRNLHPRTVLRLRGAAAVIVGGLLATIVLIYANTIVLGLLNAIQNIL